MDLPPELLAMGDILNDPVSLHPQYMPYAGFDTSQTVSQALRPYPQYYGVEEQFPYNTNSNYNSFQITVTKHLTSGLGFPGRLHILEGNRLCRFERPGGVLHDPQDYYNRSSIDRSLRSTCRRRSS